MAKDFRELRVYRNALRGTALIFKLTEKLPGVEVFSMTDQARRASRSVCANLAEAWRKRQYVAAFRAKLSDALREASEVLTWLDIAAASGYLSEEKGAELQDLYDHIIAQLTLMAKHPEQWKPSLDAPRFPLP